MRVRAAPRWLAAVALVVVGAACESGSSSASGCTGPTLAATWSATQEEASAQVGTTYYGDPARSRAVIPGALAGEPAFSPDGRRIAVAVGHGTGDGMAFSLAVVDVATGRQRVIARPESNSVAPAWSPDGRRLALTLSGSGGNLDIFVLDLATQALTRITDDPAIDTEPAWSPDGASLYFTSDRSGGPQIYRTDLATHQRVQRITFGSSYNARPRPAPDGRSLALVSREGSDYRIGLQDLASGTVRILTHGILDESPSFAPNGMSLIYAGRLGNAATLATVAVDGQVSQQLKSDRGEVREPVWGPFLSP